MVEFDFVFIVAILGVKINKQLKKFHTKSSFLLVPLKSFGLFLLFLLIYVQFLQQK